MKRHAKVLQTIMVMAIIGGGALAVHVPSTQAAPPPVVSNVAKDPRDIPPPITRSSPTTVTVNLVAKEVVAEIAPGQSKWFWTFNGTVPGPMIRVMEGDTVVINLTNDRDNNEPHNIDLHAVMGPGGGAAVTNVDPGETKTFTFKALRQGAYIYHCSGEGEPWEHVAYGMFGLIEVEPKGGLASVNKEFYIGQSDWYLIANSLSTESRSFLGANVLVLDEAKALMEHPDTFTFNGHQAALTDPAIFGKAIKAEVGDTVRFFFVTGGPNIGSNWHVIGQIFDKVYKGHSKDFIRNEETVLVPPGSAAVFELTALVPGQYLLVDHSLWRVPKGAAGFMWVDPQCTDPATCPWPRDIYSPPAIGSGH